MDKAIGFLALFVSLTALAVIVSRRSNTAGVLTALLNGIAGLQRAAVSPLGK